MKQEKIDAFMRELKALCKKHDVTIHNAYDEDVYLRDLEGSRISDPIDFEEMTATEYVEVEWERRGKPISTEQASQTMKKFHDDIKEAMESESPFTKLFNGK